MKKHNNDLHAVHATLGAYLVLIAPLAQAAELPNAGDTLRNIERSAPATPPKLPEIQIEREERPIAPHPAEVAKVKFPVKEVRIVGNTVFQKGELNALVKNYAKLDQTLSGLETAAASITDYYRKRGYFVARAYLPAQEIKNGVVEIVILEGRYGEITLNNNSRTQDAVLISHASKSQLGELINAKRLEHALLLIGDVSQVDEVLGVLRPGKEVGTSDLVIQVGTKPVITPPPEETARAAPAAAKAASLMQGSVSADNFGSRVTGRNRLGAAVQLNSPSGIGDRLEGRMLTSGQGQDYARLAYGLPVGHSGLRLGLAYTNSRYQLGEEFSALDAYGHAQVWTVSATYPLIRSRRGNLFSEIAYDQKRLEDNIGFSDIKNEKHNNILALGLSGNRSDAAGGSTVFSVRIESGSLEIDTASAKSIDESTAQTNGSYTKYSYSLARNQPLTPNTLLFLSLSGQRASKNLDSAEKMSLGGPFGVRAYPVGEATGDDGLLATVEMRYQVGQTVLPGKMHLIGFFDTGQITLNHSPYSLGENDRKLSGAGIGMALAKPRDFEARFSHARKISGSPNVSDTDKSSQSWLQFSKIF